MDATHQSNDEQTTLWNGPAGRAWVEAQELLDQALKPFEDLLVEAVSSASGGRVLDVGCGTGGTTLAIARLLGANGRSIGIDISEPMIAAARARAQRENAPASFIRADAQAHAFAPASFDMIISRFGVMFFDDPVRAFANLRRAARNGAELRFVAFRSAAENPFMTIAERAAAPLLPNFPPAGRTRPGSSRSRTGAAFFPSWSKAAGPRSISGRSMSPAPCPSRG
jgi:ubiquinone/menaquinone biosynthesis C-methylase UbiE